MSMHLNDREVKVNTKMTVRAYVNKFEKLHEYENQSKCLSETKCGRSL